MKDEIKMFLERAEGFYDNAIYNYNNGRYDLALFNIEQAIQLLIKAKLLDLKGYYEKTHNLRKLLSDLNNILNSRELEEFINKNIEIIKIIELSYIGARYLFYEFDKTDAEKGIKIYKELKEILWKIY
ncbi:HEPN domain-containing protein [Nanoarchaeota archaeon]